MLNAEILRDAEQRRLAWRCRRGLLELDIVLQAFVSKEFESLNMMELEAFDDLLALPDNEFLDLIQSSKSVKKVGSFATNTTNLMLEKLRSVRLNHNQGDT